MIEAYGLSQPAIDIYLSERECVTGVDGFTSALNNLYQSYQITLSVHDDTPTRSEHVSAIERIASLSEQLLERISKLSLQQECLITKHGYSFNGGVFNSVIKSELELLVAAANKAESNNTLVGRGSATKAPEGLVRMLVDVFEQACPSMNNRNGISKSGFVADVLEEVGLNLSHSTYKNWL